MAESWLKGLRTPQTPRNRALNNRYGSSRDLTEEEREGASPAPAGTSPSEASSTHRRTPRHAGAYERPWKDTGGITGGSRGTPRARSGLAAGRPPPVPRQGSGLEDADSASMAESDDVSVFTEDDYGGQEGESVQVFVRVRPVNAAEEAEAEQYNCTRIFGDRTLCVDLKHRPEPYQFKFDCVLPETTTQQEIFDRAGKPIVDNCMGGYNSSIFAYGQTGAGKTYTMQGPLVAAAQDGSEQRGLAPRVFEYLFTEIDKAQDENCHENLTFCCRCSMLEIYNEVITDLLNPSATNLQIREDIKKGCYVEDLSEHLIQNAADAMRIMRLGAENRHVGETRLNRESSRSHSVFACTLERQCKSQETGVTNVLFSRLNLIDLAGSERIHGGEHGGSQATGKHFKEACHINKSLTTLGRVIMELVEAQRCASKASSCGGGNGGMPGGSAGKGAAAALRSRHVPYRDSRLTFLLQDSLGGNAKTLMIANISPSSVSAQETLSTLHFMSRAKCIRNRAQINLDARGDVVLLQREIVRLNTELDNLRKGYTEPAIQENKELRDRLDKLSAAKGQMEVLLLNMEKENQNLKVERRRLDHKMAQIQKGAGQLDQAIFSMNTRLMNFEAMEAAAFAKGQDTAQTQHALELRLLQLQLEAAQQESQGADELQEEVEALRNQLADAQQQAARAVEAHDAARAEVGSLKQQLEAAQQEAAGASEQLQGQLNAAQQEAVGCAEELTTARQAAAGLAQQHNAALQEAASLQEQLQEAQAGGAGLRKQLAAVQADAAGTAEQLEIAQQLAADLSEQLAGAKQEAADLTQQLQKAREEGGAQLTDLTVQLEAATKQLQGTQQDLQATRAEADSLREQSGSLRQQGVQLQQQLEQQQQAQQELRQHLDQVQQQLVQAHQDLGDAKQQAACSEEDASRQLSEAVAGRNAAQSALQEAWDSNAGLEAQLQELRHQLAQSCQQLQAESAAHKAESEQAATAAVAASAAATAVEEQLRQQLADAQRLLAGKQDDLSGILSEKQELQGRLGLKQQQCSELQQQLQAEQSRSAEGRSQVAAQELSLTQVNAALRDKAAGLEAAEDQLRHLQLHMDTAAAAAAARTEQLASDLAAVREAGRSRQEELMKQVTEVHLQLSGAQQEQERLQDELDAARSDNSLLQGQLAEAQGHMDHLRGQASSKGLDCELLAKKLSAAEATAAVLRSDLDERQQQLADLKHQLQLADQAAVEQQQEAAEQLSELQRQLMDAQQELEARGFEATQLQRRMEELSNRLADRSSSLETAKEEIKGLKAAVSKLQGAARQREDLLADKTGLAERLQAEVEALQARNHQLLEENAMQHDQLQGKLSEHELKLKTEMVYNMRNRKAMNEIRKVINWAQQVPQTPTAPATARERSGSSHQHRHQQQLLPLAIDTGSLPGSPASFADMQEAVHGSPVGDHMAEPVTEEPLRLSPQQVYQGSGGSSSSGRHHHHGSSSHVIGGGSSSSRRHHHHHQQQQQQQQHGLDRYGELLVTAASATSAGSHRSCSSSTDSAAVHGLQARHSAAGEHLVLQQSGNLEVNGSAPAAAAAATGGGTSTPHAVLLSPPSPPSSGLGRDTAGGAGPQAEAAGSGGQQYGRSGIGRGRLRSSRGCESPTRRSAGSKQQLAGTATATASHHKPHPDQQHHHQQQQQHHSQAHQQLRQQEVYTAAVSAGKVVGDDGEEAADDLLPPVAGAEGSFDTQHGHLNGTDGRAELTGDGSARQLMAPQQASSPLPPSPKTHLHGSTAGRSRGPGRDAASRGGLRLGSDSHCFSSLTGKHHKVLGSGVEAPNVVLSVSAEWSAGGHDGLPDMRLPAAIVGDCEPEP